MPLLIVQAVMAALAAAPQAVELANAAREFVTQLFKAGLITKEVQDATFDYVNAVTKMHRLGIISPSFQVQPDPGPSNPV
jgi:hypothetical protein